MADSSRLEDSNISLKDDGHALMLEEGEPFSYHEAQASLEKLEWDAPMQREIQSFIDNKT